MSHLSIDPHGVSGQGDFYLGSNGNTVRGVLRAATAGRRSSTLRWLASQSAAAGRRSCDGEMTLCWFFDHPMNLTNDKFNEIDERIDALATIQNAQG